MNAHGVEKSVEQSPVLLIDKRPDIRSDDARGDDGQKHQHAIQGFHFPAGHVIDELRHHQRDKNTDDQAGNTQNQHRGNTVEKDLIVKKFLIVTETDYGARACRAPIGKGLYDGENGR